MKENDRNPAPLRNQKNKIRERYKGVSIDELDVIPGTSTGRHIRC